MSVHGEYSRAIQSLLTIVEKLEVGDSKKWVGAINQVRSSQHPDLSSAARACVQLLEALDAERGLSSIQEIGPDSDPLREPFFHLLGHCKAILGLQE